ncbi:hypothetical protein PRIPAC_90796 [Pristionchus pacificus]|uniref:Peptidase n=1 Tax=Pristionchus pacificus TaxID=54126 RepID=A0A2A6B7Z3_PRIPA|nr:hypothetical protein PRIPAC_90796 [Pristionchus pacificus]|eukprot:PDM61998.1 Peptidase [Pristionchus pacificus]
MIKLPLLLLFTVSRCLCSEESLPRYMRGINWPNVEKYRHLSGNIIPVHYSINLSVNVRGRNNAVQSDYNGTVIISLIAKATTDNFELHSCDLVIVKVNIFGGDVMKSDVAVTRISTNSDRETLIFDLNRRLDVNEKIELEITYRGVARMDEYGLYENWTPQFNESRPSFVLSSKNFPVGARRWFPCFDESNKQTTFLLTVSHPQGLNAYSNTEKRDMVDLNDGRVTAYFKLTKKIPTYKLALAIIDFSKVRITASSMVKLYRSENHPGLSESMRENDLIVALEKNIILLDGTKTITAHPGLITIGRDAQSQEYSEITRRIGEVDFDLGSMYIRKNDRAAHKYSQIISEKGASNLTKIVVGNRLTVSSDQMWFVDGLSRFFNNDTVPDKYLYFYPSVSYIRYINIKPDHFYTSIHEPALRKKAMLSSTSLFLDSEWHSASLKAWQLFAMVDRMCPDARKVFISSEDDDLANVNHFLGEISDKCGVSVTEFLSDFIDHPGKAFLIVSRTRFTLPIFYTIDGIPSMKMFPKNDSSIIVRVAENATFLIENNYDHVYYVYYDFMMPVLRNWDEEKFTMTLAEEEQEKRPLREHAVKSLLSALEIGFIKYETAIEQITGFSNKTYECRRHPQFIEQTRWNDLFNNGSRYFEDIDSRPFDMSNYCMNEWQNASTYLSFLEENVIGDAVSIVRAGSIDYVRQKGGSTRSWKEFHRFFFNNVHNETTPTWNRLTQVALGLKPFGDKPKVDWFYPRADWQNDYLEELRTFIRKHPKRAASMAVEIEMRLEREFIREERRKFFGLTEQKVLETAKKLWTLLPDYE